MVRRVRRLSALITARGNTSKKASRSTQFRRRGFRVRVGGGFVECESIWLTIRVFDPGNATIPDGRNCLVVLVGVGDHETRESLECDCAYIVVSG